MLPGKDNIAVTSEPPSENKEQLCSDKCSDDCLMTKMIEDDFKNEGQMKNEDNPNTEEEP